MASLDQTGISLELVYRLELINRQLDRLYTLLAFLAPATGSPVAGGWQRFMQTLIRGGVRDKTADGNGPQDSMVCKKVGPKFTPIGVWSTPLFGDGFE